MANTSDIPNKHVRISQKTSSKKTFSSGIKNEEQQKKDTF
jgi:hypothetical protein